MNLPRWAPIPRYGRDVWLLGLAAALFTGGFLGMMQLLKVMYVLRLGFGPEFVGALFACGSLSFTFSSLPGAALGERFGPRRMLFIGGIVNVVGLAILPLTEFVPEGLRALWPLLVQVISSSGWSMLMVNMVTSLVAVTTPENRRGAYAMREALSGLGMFVGTLIGGMLPALFAGLLGLSTDQPAPYRYGLWVAVLVSLCGLLPLLWVRAVPHASRSRRARYSWKPLLPVLPLLACAFLHQGAVASCKAFTYAYMDREFLLPTAVVGSIASVGMFVAIPAALSSTGLARKQGSGFAMMIASWGLAGGLLVMGLIPHWVAAGVGTMAQFVLAALFVPAYQVMQMELADPEWRWLVAGAGNMCMSLGFGTISLTGGYIVAAAGYRQLFLLGALCALGAGTLMWHTLRRRAARLAPDPAP
jgi:MFS family permease